MSDIFISYNREDQEKAALFAHAFKAAGLDVWWDVSLKAGQVYDEVTENALRSARAVIVLWSPRSAVSRWVRAEATLAQRAETFVPCMIEPCERPIMFELTQTPDLSHWQGDQADPAWCAFLEHVREFTGSGDRAETDDARLPQKNKAAAAPIDERRQVTFLAASLAGGESLASSLDPEDWRDLLASFHDLATPIIDQFGGGVTYSGHRLSATFGYPLVQEHAAERAIRAALALVAETASMSRGIAGVTPDDLALQVGVHTATVLVTADSGGEAEMFGDGATGAEAAAQSASGNAVHVTQPVRQLAGGAFELEPVAGSDVFRVGDARKRVELVRGWAAGANHGFVGRTDEIAALRTRWERTESGEGQHVLVRGEPGIGKTRLVEEFHAWLGGREHHWITLQGASLFANTPYHAIGQFVAQQAEGRSADAGEWLRSKTAERDLPARLLPLLAPVIGISLPDGVQPTSAAQDQQRVQLLSALVETAFALARRKPLLLLVDDIQWIDPSTLELVQMLVDQAQDDRIMVLATARPEFEPPWGEGEHHLRVTLGPLGRKEMRALVAEMAGERVVDDAVLTRVLERANGVPLFAEELARLMADEPDQAADAMPPTLRDLLAARLARLGETRETLQVAAVLGLEFDQALLAALAPDDPSGLETPLAHLVRERFLIMRGVPPMASYRFKHALVRDAAYETLPKRRQKVLHRLAAETLARRPEDGAQIAREVLASHWMQAGDHTRALTEWQAAGDEAYRRGACKEAVVHFQRGIDAATMLSEGPERYDAELRLWSALNRALQQTRGYSDPQTVDAANRALALAKEGGLLVKTMIEEAQLWRAVITSGDYREADAIAERVITLGSEIQNDDRPAWLDYFAANAVLQTDFYSGRLHDLPGHYARFEEIVAQSGAGRHVMDDIVGMGIGALGAWMRARQDVAQQRMDDAVARGEASGQPYAAAVGHHFASTLAWLQRDYAGTRFHAQTALDLTQEHGLAYIGHLVRGKLAWASAEDRPTEEAAEVIRQSIEEMVASNGRVGMIFYLNRLAEILSRLGRLDEANEAIEQALVANPQERIVRPQSLIIRAGLRVAQGDIEAAEDDLLSAHDLAAEMGALAIELEAATQLGGLLEQSGRMEEARRAIELTLAKCDSSSNCPALPEVRAALARLST
uniref:AAA family ATPase n=1 Tax=Parerythrobacter lutipelagi TaxID=1964208 RepID=UPI0010F4E8F9|nr:AAA family ATPase [Parerythrobacter lutipelagi]